MSEGYTFSGQREKLDELELTENEVDTITRLGITPEDLKELLASQPYAEGSRALLFSPQSDSKLLIKVWKNRKIDSERGASENTALRLLRMRNFQSAPITKGYLESSKVLFEEKIEGRPIDKFNQIIIKQLATALANLHSIKLNKYGKPLSERREGTRMDYLHENAEALRLASSHADQAEITELINRSLDKIEVKASETGEAFLDTSFTLIHFDLNKGNILYSDKDNSIAIVDWEQSSAGDNAMDIAKLFFKSNFDSNQRQNFLEQYESQLPERDPHLQARLLVYEPFVLANSILWRLGVLKNKPKQASSEKENQFYDQVSINLDKETQTLKKWLL